MRNSSLKHSGMARGITQVYLPPICLSTSGMNYSCLCSPAAQRHRTLACTHFRSHWG